MKLISVTSSVLKSDKFTDNNELHPKNIRFILFIFEVVISGKIIDSNELQPGNILLISVNTEKSKWVKSIDTIFSTFGS